MLFLSYAAYLGGLYISNAMDNWNLLFNYDSQYVKILHFQIDDEYEKIKDELNYDGKLKFIDINTDNYISWKTIMGFSSGGYFHTFTSVEDFKNYCEYMNIDCDFKNIKKGSMILSDIFAKNIGKKIGDKLKAGRYDNFSLSEDFTLDCITNENGYVSYFISNEDSETHATLIFGDEIENYQVRKRIENIKEKYNILFFPALAEEITEQFAIFNAIYTFIIIIMAVIMAVTVNAAFVGMYQRRNFEFSVYRAIGIPKRKIIGKIISEIICMDIAAVIFGGAVFFLIIYLLNNIVLYPDGKYLQYYSEIAIMGFLLCNIMILIPLIITRCKQMMKADICEY